MRKNKLNLLKRENKNTPKTRTQLIVGTHVLGYFFVLEGGKSINGSRKPKENEKISKVLVSKNEK